MQRWRFNPRARDGELAELMAAPGAPRCEDCGLDLEHPYDMKCERCLRSAARRRDAWTAEALATLEAAR